MGIAITFFVKHSLSYLSTQVRGIAMHKTKTSPTSPTALCSWSPCATHHQREKGRKTKQNKQVSDTLSPRELFPCHFYQYIGQFTSPDSFAGTPHVMVEVTQVHKATSSSHIPTEDLDLSPLFSLTLREEKM